VQSQCERQQARQSEFLLIVHKTSMAKANEGFVRIAATTLSIAILASGFAGWSAIYPEANQACNCRRQRS
jgi:hypothetical protein